MRASPFMVAGWDYGVSIPFGYILKQSFKIYLKSFVEVILNHFHAHTAGSAFNNLHCSLN